MKILQTSSSPHWGGAQIRALTEAAGLRARGHEVVIVSPPGTPIAQRAGALRIPVLEVPSAAGPQAARVPAWLAMRRVVAAGGFDALATHGTIDTWLAALACASLRGAPPIVRTHHATAPAPHGAASRWLYMRAACIVTTGDSVRQALVRDHGLDGRRIVPIPTGIDLGHYRPAAANDVVRARQALQLPDDGLPVLGIVASLRRSKGHHLLLEALAALAGQGKPARLLIVGDGPQRAALEKQAAALLPEDRVLFAGAQADVLPWLQALDVFVLPTLHEGVPQSLSQAMGAGLCCVTTAVGGIPEIAADDSAVFVPPGDVDALRKALARVIDNAALRARFGARARAAALERCSIEAMLDRMETLYADVAAARPRKMGRRT